jgi:hypothetical protein
MPKFRLTLQKTYYDQGFFNVSVDFDRHVRQDDGEVTLVLGGAEKAIASWVYRRANQNGTARVRGGPQLRDWFRENFRVMDPVEVDFLSAETMRLSKRDD